MRTGFPSRTRRRGGGRGRRGRRRRRWRCGGGPVSRLRRRTGGRRGRRRRGRVGRRSDPGRRLGRALLPRESDVPACRHLERTDAHRRVGPRAGRAVGPPQRPVRRRGRRAHTLGGGRPVHLTDERLALHVGQGVPDIGELRCGVLARTALVTRGLDAPELVEVDDHGDARRSAAGGGLGVRRDDEARRRGRKGHGGEAYDVSQHRHSATVPEQQPRRSLGGGSPPLVLARVGDAVLLTGLAGRPVIGDRAALPGQRRAGGLCSELESRDPGRRSPGRATVSGEAERPRGEAGAVGVRRRGAGAADEGPVLPLLRSPATRRRPSGRRGARRRLDCVFHSWITAYDVASGSAGLFLPQLCLGRPSASRS